MNLYTFLLISKDSELKQLLQAASPQTSIHAAGTISEGLALWSDMSPTLVVAEGNAHTLTPLLEYARQVPHSPPLLVIGDRHSLKDAVEIMRAGAADYLAKPILLEDLLPAITRTLHHPGPTPSSSPYDPFASIISVSPQMNLMKQLAKEVAVTDATVLITGDSGTGKELFAEA
ncbi:MAG: sigma 54-interacting transcriptional regulator, partial [Nitrospirota bacterium]